MINKIIFFMLFVTVNCYQPVSELNIPQYLGRWYQVYQDLVDSTFQGRGSCITADYGMFNESTVSVLNSEISTKGKLQQIRGIAYYDEGNTGGELTVKLANLSPAPYWVIELGPIVDDMYDYTIISDDKKLSLFVLARDVDKFLKYYNNDVLKSLENFGFDKFYNEPILSNQTECSYV